MELSDYLYDLPKKLIAQYPCVPRDGCRLLHLPEIGGATHHGFRDLPSLLSPGDLLVLNDTRVVPARLLGRRPGGGKAEIFLLRPSGNDDRWEAYVRPGKRLGAGSIVTIGKKNAIEIIEELGEGRRLVRPIGGVKIPRLMATHGSVPLPPYITRSAEANDSRRYQTVYANGGRSVAAPTAGLHFTPRLFKALEKRGVDKTFIRLDVGPGTFKPVAVRKVEDHRMDSEPYVISKNTAIRINGALFEGRRVVAVGTTVTRTLEDQMLRFGRVQAGEYETRLFIVPGFKFRAVSGLVTNFHLPASTLIMLVSALSGRKRVLAAYGEAARRGYRFYSYGDAMLAWGGKVVSRPIY